jgi:tellurite resistance protein TehA-like permease
MTFYSFVFPNTALITATQAIGKALSSRPLQIVGTVLAGVLVLIWFLVFGAMVRALVLRRLLWPENENTDDRRKEPAIGENNESA